MTFSYDAEKALARIKTRATQRAEDQKSIGTSANLANQANPRLAADPPLAGLASVAEVPRDFRDRDHSARAASSPGEEQIPAVTPAKLANPAIPISLPHVAGPGTGPLLEGSAPASAGPIDVHSPAHKTSIAGSTPIIATATTGTAFGDNASTPSDDITISADAKITGFIPFMSVADNDLTAATSGDKTSSVGTNITTMPAAMFATEAGSASTVASAGITPLRRPQVGCWSTEDWQDYFGERAGIAEFDHGLSRPQAEARAFQFCLAEWLNRNPAYSKSDRCVVCGDADRPNDPAWPTGIASAGEAWMHRGCSVTWSAARQAQAVAALASMGISTSGGR